MSQNIIDTGQAANDGTGEPLRQAFTAINNNFSQIWTSGPVNSNVQITDNKILTLQINQNLVLAPNGIGDVQANNNIVPDIDHVRDLGNVTNRWDTVWAYYIEAQSANIGTATIGNIGNITVGVNNIHILGGSNGYVLQTDGTGNLSWTAQTGGSGNGTPGGANTQVQFNDAGSFGGYPGFTFNNTTGNLNVPESVVANAFVGDGSQLTGIDANNINGLATVAFTGDYNDLSNIPTPYGDSNVTTLLADFGSNTISTTGNITVGYVSGTNIGNITPVNLDGNVGNVLAGDGTWIQAGGAVVQSATPPIDPTDQTLWWDEVSGRLYVWYDDGITAQWVDAAPAAFGGGNINTNGGISALGNITAAYFIGNGSQLTGLPAGYANSNVVAYGESGWDGNIIPAGNAVYTLGNSTNQWSDLYVSNATIYMNNIPISLSAGNVLTVDGQPVLSNDANTSISTTGNISATYFVGDGSQLTNLPVVAESPFIIKTGNFEATAGGRYGVDTWSADGPVTATLPASPNTGDAVFFADAGNYANNGALTIDAGLNSIMDGSSTMTVTTNNQSVGLFWNGRTWRTYNAG